MRVVIYAQAPEELRDEARRRAEECGASLNALVVRAIEFYLHEKFGVDPPERQALP